MELIGPLAADLYKLAAELVADNDRVFRDVVRNALVLCPLMRRLIRGLEKAVLNYPRKYFVVLDLGKLELLKTEIVFAI